LNNRCKLTVFFDQQFYRGVFERWSATDYQVARVTFGTQPPTNAQIQGLINNRWSTLRWTIATTVDQEQLAQNLRQKVRRARHEVSECRQSRQATAVLKLAHQHNLVVKKQRRKAARQAHREQLYQTRQVKRLAKHRGH